MATKKNIPPTTTSSAGQVSGQDAQDAVATAQDTATGAAPVTTEVARVYTKLVPSAPAAAPAAPITPADVATKDATHVYLVGSVPIRHDGETYGIGSQIALTDDQAARLPGLRPINDDNAE